MVRLLPLLIAAVCANSAGRHDLFDAIRAGDHARVGKLIAGGADVNAANDANVPPLLHAVITGDLNMVKLLLAKGANPRAAGESGITALHAAVFDPALTRALLEAGADANAATSNGQTPIFGALVHGGSGPVLDILLKHGANVNAVRGSGASKSVPLRSAFVSRDPKAVKRLLDAGADAKLAEPFPRSAMQGGCVECVKLLLAAGAKATDRNVADAAAPGSLAMVKALVESGAPVNGQDPRGYTPLMRAVLSHTRNEDLVGYLLDKGADTGPKNETGDTALSMARRYGTATPIAARLAKAGADGPEAKPIPAPIGANAVEAAITRSVALLEKIGAPVFKRRGCVSCHNNTQPAMVVAMARRRGFAVDENAARTEVKQMIADTRARRQILMTGSSIPEIVEYVLLALDMAGHPPDAATDLAFHQIAFRQEPEGYWRVDDYRPPQEYSSIASTALAIRAMQAYAPPGRASEARERAARAGKWLTAARPYGVEEHAMRLLGLGWLEAPKGTIQEAVRNLEAEQAKDGGWPQLPGMESDPYATGLAMYALQTSGGMSVSHPAYRRGVRNLLDAQRPDGSWFVQTRSYPFQPYFESGYPYGHSQWISAAGASWATMALLLTVPEKPR